MVIQNIYKNDSLGGGARGVIPAVFLNEIAKATGKKIHELFNCIGGRIS